MACVIVIADDPGVCPTIAHVLTGEHQVHGLRLNDARGRVPGDIVPDLVFLDLEEGSPDAVELLACLTRAGDAAPVIGLVGRPDARTIVAAMRAGALDVIVMPLRAADVRDGVFRALTARAADGEPAGTEMQEIVGVSPAIERLRILVSRVARADAPVLVEGESGVGKELVARAIHRLSRRADGPFEARNCGALPEQLFESEMFGTEKGAYTGAVRRSGAFELAHEGTLFLDEVGELSPANQVKLLRALEYNRFHRVGGTVERTADVRIVCATNRDLQVARTEGSFRTDLYYRINVLRLTVPPLRQRKEDIPLLVRHFFRHVLNETDDGLLTSDAFDRLAEYNWPGNIRELRNVVHRIAVCAEKKPVRGHEIRLG